MKRDGLRLVTSETSNAERGQRVEVIQLAWFRIVGKVEFSTYLLVPCHGHL